MEFRTAAEKEFIVQTITNGTFSVDTFFFIRFVVKKIHLFIIIIIIIIIIINKIFLFFSGLLVSFLYFRTTAKVDVDSLTGAKGIKSNILQFIGLLAYRYGRFVRVHVRK